LKFFAIAARRAQAVRCRRRHQPRRPPLAKAHQRHAIAMPKKKRASSASTLGKLVVDCQDKGASDGELTTASRQGEKSTASRDQTRQSSADDRARHSIKR